MNNSRRNSLLYLGLVVFIVAGPAAWAYWSWGIPQRSYEEALDALKREDVAGVELGIARLDGYSEYLPHQQYLIGTLCLWNGQLEDALGHFEMALEYPPLEVETLVLSGRALYQMGQAGGAQRLWERAIAQDPKAVDAYRWLGAFYYDLGAMQLAIDHLSEVGELDRSDPRPYRLMGLINKDYERFDRAIADYRESLRRAPDQQEGNRILLELAECFIRLHKYPDARETLARAAPGVEHLVLEAECRMAAAEQEQALRLVKQALEEQSDHAGALGLLGRILMASGELEEAARTFEIAVEKYPHDHKMRFSLSQAYRRLGDNDRADRHIKAAEELRLLWTEFSDLHVDAVGQPSNAKLRCQIGEIAVKLGRPELARNWFVAALAIDPSLEAAAEQLDKLTSTEAGE